MSECRLCPRNCGADRSQGALGFCASGSEVTVAKSGLHFFEEPCISGSRGSGTVFFCGCSLRCVYCQNRSISRSSETGRVLCEQDLGELFLSLQQEGAHNLNLVTPTHFADTIARTLRKVRSQLHIPVVWNTSGYERVETLQSLEDLVDIYLTDFKYASPALSTAYSSAPDYAEKAVPALAEMVRQTGSVRKGRDGLLRSGVLVRHLILPGHRHDSMAVLRLVADTVSPSEILLSLMRQYTPDFARDTTYPNLHRRLTSFEYESVADYAETLGFEGYRQGRESAAAEYTPNFTE